MHELAPSSTPSSPSVKSMSSGEVFDARDSYSPKPPSTSPAPDTPRDISHSPTAYPQPDPNTDTRHELPVPTESLPS